MKYKTPVDIIADSAELHAVDPRPINYDIRADKFIRYLDTGGFLAGMTDDERRHITMKLHTLIIGCVRDDRMAFHGIDNATEDDD
jgi:hypothetical protein